jgi:hypothetical protein
MRYYLVTKTIFPLNKNLRIFDCFVVKPMSKTFKALFAGNEIFKNMTAISAPPHQYSKFALLLRPQDHLMGALVLAFNLNVHLELEITGREMHKSCMSSLLAF